jgi:hypothetical protein
MKNKVTTYLSLILCSFGVVVSELTAPGLVGWLGVYFLVGSVSRWSWLVWLFLSAFNLLRWGITGEAIVRLFIK